MGSVQARGLYELARLHNVQLAYYDVFGRRRQSSPEGLLRVLRTLGAPLERMGDAADALREHRRSLWQRCIEPVVVAWQGRPIRIELRIPADRADGALAVRLDLETGEALNWSYRLPGLRTVRRAATEGTGYLIKRLSLPRRPPWGYHRLTLETGGRVFRTLVISAPLKAYTGSEERERAWGVFLPLYALHSNRSWGGGDFSDLEALALWTRQAGGDVVGTLPLLAAFLDAPFEPSPYAPVSRLFWNEIYLDVDRVPELERCPAARALLSSSGFQKGLGALRSSGLVDYRRQMALKREVLERLARVFFAGGGQRRRDFQRFLEAHPLAEDYARFRATCERRRSPWPTWTRRLREGVLTPGDYSQESQRYHLYVQWLVREQLSAVAEKARESGSKLYLDLPLGVHREGYDVWRERDLFALDCSGGAPPDSVFTQGQSWGFPPIHPEKVREQGYRYTIAMLRNHLRYAGLLRIDHVMGLHRLFWIPQGLEPRDGVYVRYRAEEIYAILNLESRRHQALVAGENLGTVPAYVNAAMVRHSIQRMYVVQYELRADRRRALPAVPRDCVASLNTHDMRPFASFWEALDIQDRIDLGLLDQTGARVERKSRHGLRRALVRFLRTRGWLRRDSSDILSVLRACLAYLSASPARLLLINLEDLWLEHEPQNIPSTRDDNANWCRKSRYRFEDLSRLPRVAGILGEVDRRRREARSTDRRGKQRRPALRTR